MNALIESIFLYNCEVWTLTVELEQKIDIIQRQLLRRVLGIKWYDKVTNNELYERVNCKKWSEKITRPIGLKIFTTLLCILVMLNN